MRRPASAPVIVVAALLASATARAQTAPTAACAPAIELSGAIPPRVVQRLRRVIDLATTSLPPNTPCSASRARLDWSERELTVHIALDDGRVAVRTLESLEDLLPTVLAVLAVPPPDPTAEPARARVEAPAPATTTPASVAVVVVPVPVAAPAATPAPVAPPSNHGTGWSLLVSGTVGASFSQSTRFLGRWTAEVGAATPRFALTLRGGMDLRRSGANDDNGFRRDDLDGTFDRTQAQVVASARARWSSTRLRGEVGGYLGASHDADYEISRWLPRLGLEASVGWRFTPSLGAFVRAEAWADVYDDRPVPAFALSLGASWEPRR